MKNFKISILVLLLLGISSFLLLSAANPKEKKLRHVVAFKFKPEVTKEQMQKATQDFHALKGKVPQIIEFEGGPDVSFQDKSGKFTHCFIVTVRNEEDLAAYGSHPDHQAFSKSVDPLLEEVMVVDYWTE
ncbi:Dabb family protein [Pontibacter toksunensis]|uniref:Dabb family protein n=1 Tax=Pontibacter toksunensis TaxID=1332631 RepID=A0ABW6BRH8_9BACT